MSDGWYYADRGKPVGPFGLADLRASIQEFSNRKNLLVWRDGFSKWQRAESVKELSALGAAPPPIPESSAPELLSGLAPAREKSRGRSVAKILGGIALFAAGVIVGAFGNIVGESAYEFGESAYKFVTQLSMAKNTSDIEKESAEALVKLRAELPKKIDETTTLMWVRNEGTRLIYENRVAIDGAKLDDATKDKLRQSVTKNVCATAGTRRILDLGGSLSYAYTDIAAKPVMTIDIFKHNCL